MIELSPRDRIGSTQALQPFIGFSVGAVAPVLAGSILDATRSTAAWGFTFSFNGEGAVIGVLSLLWLRRITTGPRPHGAKTGIGPT